MTKGKRRALMAIFIALSCIFAGIVSGSFTCSNNSDCNDINPKTFDNCVNPGTNSSYCTYTQITCLNDLDCDFTGFVGQEFCFSNNVYKNFKNSTCVNPGTLLSSCNINLTARLVNNCNDNNPLTIDSCVENPARCENIFLICSDNSECGNTRLINNFCLSNSLMSNYSVPVCSNSVCGSSNSIVLNETCAYGCSNGICSNPVCVLNQDCGNSSSQLVCQGNNVINITFMPECNNNSCEFSNSNQTITNCSFSCSNGLCVSPSLCSNNSDCGNNSFIGNKYCYNDHVYQDFITYICNNSCQNSISKIKIKNCAWGCSQGSCDSESNDKECKSCSSSISINYCGDGICDNSEEDEQTCPNDCKISATGSYYKTNSTTVYVGKQNQESSNWILILIIIGIFLFLLLFLLFLFFLLKK